MDLTKTPPIVVTEPARDVLRRHLADSPENRFIRVNVARG